MVFLISLALWCACISLCAFHLKLNFSAENNFGNKQRILLILLSILTAFFVFRPHEDILVGQDSAAYINMAAAFSEENAINFQDPLLQQIPLEDKELFFVRQGAPRYSSSDFTLWIKDLEQSQLAPKFFLAYPLLMSFCFDLGIGYYSLWVCPLFSVLLGLNIAAFLQRVFKRSSISFIFLCLFWFSPFLQYHAHSIRAEIIASTFFWIGLSLLQYALSNPTRTLPKYWFYSGLSFGLMLLFHFSSVMVFPALTLLTAVYFVRSRDKNVALLYAGMTLAVMVLALQSFFILDPYHVDRYLKPFLIASPLILGLLWGGTAKMPERIRQNPKPLKLSPWLSSGLFLGVISIGLWKHGEGIDLRYLTLNITDLHTCIDAISLPLFISGCIGIILIPLLKKNPLHWLPLFVALPLLITGTFFDFSLTRYLLITSFPALIIGASLLYAQLPQGKALYASPLFILLGLGALDQRDQLFNIQEKEGSWENLASIAEEVKANDGILFSEYAGFAAPLKYIWGIDALTASHQQSLNRDKLWTAWAKLMKENPDRPAYYISHFQAPKAGRFSFEKRLSQSFKNEVFVPIKGEIPNRVIQKPFELSLYKMAINKNDVTAGELPIGEGNINLLNFSETHTKTWKATLCVFHKNKKLSFPKSNDTGTVYSIYYSPKGAPQIEASVGSTVLPTKAAPLSNNW